MKAMLPYWHVKRLNNLAGSTRPGRLETQQKRPLPKVWDNGLFSRKFSGNFYFFTSFAQLSRSPTVRLKTRFPEIVSLSTAK